MAKYVEPSVKATAFNCPHCGTLTTQTWSRIFADNYGGKGLPPFLEDGVIAQLEENKSLDAKQRERLLQVAIRHASGEVFYYKTEGNPYPSFHVGNLNISQCYECKKLAIWLHDRMLFPNAQAGIEPNEDLDEGIKYDFNEARAILDTSPRGAAALLRLAVQKLCKQLGECGKNIDDDIAALVSKGLNPLMQKALDVVRVIGNEAVHPGTLDLRDDRTTAFQLLKIINSIAEQMISHPKHVELLYGMLPEQKRNGIDARNAKAIAKATLPKPESNVATEAQEDRGKLLQRFDELAAKPPPDPIEDK